MNKTTLYKPRDIARLGLIKNSKNSDKEDSNYYFVLKLIKTGQLKATNYGITKNRPYWLVSEKEIERFNSLRAA